MLMLSKQLKYSLSMLDELIVEEKKLLFGDSAAWKPISVLPQTKGFLT